jgi:hypothetical protein
MGSPIRQSGRDSDRGAVVDARSSWPAGSTSAVFEAATMIEKRSYEQALAQFEEILRRYRRGVSAPGAPDGLSRGDAIALLMKLHFTPGEAMHLLGPPSGKTPAK